MKPPENRVVRPTFRCLVDDLAKEVGPAELQGVMTSVERDLTRDRYYLLPIPLAAAEHILLDKANLLVHAPAARREPTESITDRTTVKVKAADRRGALWRDGDGVWWLLAAGRRKDDGPGDFYREIVRYRDNSDPIAPTEQDRRYLRFEAAYIAECAAEREAQTRVVQTLLHAAADPGRPHSVEAFGAVVTVSLDPENDGSETLSMAFDFTTFQERDRFPVDVIGFVPGYESIDDWDILPALRAGDPECWYTFVSQSWIEWLAISVELEQFAEGPQAAPTPSVPASGQRSHRARASVVTLAYVEGVEITALCGVRFSPHRDPDRFEECPGCAAALALLRRGA